MKGHAAVGKLNRVSLWKYLKCWGLFEIHSNPASLTTQNPNPYPEGTDLARCITSVVRFFMPCVHRAWHVRKSAGHHRLRLHLLAGGRTRPPGQPHDGPRLHQAKERLANGCMRYCRPDGQSSLFSSLTADLTFLDVEAGRLARHRSAGADQPPQQLRVPCTFFG